MMPSRVPQDRRPGVAVAIVYRLPGGAAMPAPWPENAQINGAYVVSERRGYCTQEYWPVTANAIMLYGLWKLHGVRALCVPLNP
jgi:hypothetical protein